MRLRLRARGVAGDSPEMSVEEGLKNGPKEPLVPPIIQVVAEPAPGSTMTMEPLVPPVVTVSPTAADPGAAGAE
ncbi:MAG: hypothetical protein R3B70_41850 [Polyangiaceae bacterium]